MERGHRADFVDVDATVTAAENSTGGGTEVLAEGAGASIFEEAVEIAETVEDTQKKSYVIEDITIE